MHLGGFLALSAVLWAALPSRGVAAESIYRGEAIDLKTGSPAYSEVHEEIFAEGRRVKTMTRYLSPAGRPIAERTLDYSRFALKPDFVLDDFRDGYREGARVGDSGITVFFRSKSGQPLRRKTLRVPEPCVIEGGFHGFFKAHWDSLAAGNRLELNFVAPSQLDYFAFVAYMEPAAGKNGADGREARERVIVLEVKNPLARLLVDPIRVTYNASTRRILRYEGISNINDARGKSLKVRMTYVGTGP